jgi:hypothetical protein
MLILFLIIYHRWIIGNESELRSQPPILAQHHFALTRKSEQSIAGKVPDT